MRLALLSDIHGNTLALDAVLADIDAQGGVDGFAFVGDYCALGYDPAGVLERITTQPNAIFVRGNADRYVTSPEYQRPTIAEAETNPSLLPLLVDVARSFAWTQGAITAVGYFEWMANLPLEARLILPNGTRLLFVHAAPSTDDGLGIRRDHSDDALRGLLRGCEADLVIVGHTHIPLEHTIDGVRVFNLGSLSNPHMPDMRAWYALLDADVDNYRIIHRQVAYDLKAVVKEIQRSKHPTPDFLISHFRGEQLSNIFRK